MPFDGTQFRVMTVPDTGSFPIGSKHGRRLWFETRFRIGKQRETTQILLRAAARPDRGGDILQLLQDARD